MTDQTHSVQKSIEQKINSLSKTQQDIYYAFINRYSGIEESFAPSYLKYAHCAAQYQISLDASDNTLLTLLPPELASPTAIQVVTRFYQDKTLGDDEFKILLPFIIFEFAGQANLFPQCNDHSAKLDLFEKFVCDTRHCLNNSAPEEAYICKKISIVRTQFASYEDSYEQIIDLAKNSLGIYGVTDFYLHNSGDLS